MCIYNFFCAVLKGMGPSVTERDTYSVHSTLCYNCSIEIARSFM